MVQETALDLLVDECGRLGVRLPPEAPRDFAQYIKELLEWNQRVNLTGITDPARLVLRHFVDSLAGLLVLPPAPAAGPDLAVVDVGTGAGFPGLPMKLARPSLHLTLLDSVGKRTAFLHHLVGVLELPDVAVITARAEDLARQPQHRERFDAALSRAVAPLRVLLELLLPLVRAGGCAVAWKYGNMARELGAAEGALDMLGGRLARTWTYRLPGDHRDRVLLVFQKERPCPPAYPRRPGLPAKRPL